jgi:hypothetical protein
MRMHNRFQTWIPDVTEGHVTMKGFPWKGARMRNRKLRCIHPSGAFLLEMTLSNISFSRTFSRSFSNRNV